MKYTFFWSPEGRKLATYEAKDEAEAKRLFRADHPKHAKYMGEVYVETDEAKKARPKDAP